MLGMARLLFLLACVDAARLPAEGSALLQSRDPERRRSHVQEAVQAESKKQAGPLCAHSVAIFSRSASSGEGAALQR